MLKTTLSPSSPVEPHILVQDLTMTYGNKIIQTDLNFTVNRGDVFIIMGKWLW